MTCASSRLFSVRLVAIAVVLVGSTLFAATPSQADGHVDREILASDAQPGDRFGHSVDAASDGTIVVGTYNAVTTGGRTGAAWVFVPDGSGGYQETKLVASDAAAGDYFGWDVAVNDGGTVVVASERHVSGERFQRGAVYRFEPDGQGGYTETKLVASDGIAIDYFGRSVDIAIDGTIAVGAWQANGLTVRTGAAYLYTPDGGGFSETRLVASDGLSFDQFGAAIAIADDGTLVVGAPGHGDATGAETGSAYLFEPDGSGGLVETKLVASNGSDGDAFGQAVAIGSDGRTAIGAYRRARFGAVYVYDPDGAGGLVETELLASDRALDDFFGHAVAVRSDGTVIVGADLDDDHGTGSGSVYLFEPDGTGGHTQMKLTASDGAQGDHLGASVAALPDGTVVAGAFWDDTAGTDAGSVHVFTPPTPVDTTPPTVIGTTDREPNAAGWFNTAPVRISWTVVDPEPSSGIAVVPPDVLAAGEGQVAHESEPGCDVAGNCATGTVQVAIDTVAPTIGSIEPTFNPIPAGESTVLMAVVDDATSGVVGGELFVGPDPGEGAGQPVDVSSGMLSISLDSLDVGVHEVSMRARDAADNWSTTSTALLAVFDPAAGSVSGGGWIDSPTGALIGSDATGRATFGFVAAYRRGATTPQGNTTFQFHAGDFRFKATGYDWLVVAGQDRAKFKGQGTVNGQGDYGFMLTVTDGDPDTLRMQIWDRASGGTVYDNHLGSSDGSYAGTALEGGNIRISAG